MFAAGVTWWLLWPWINHGTLPPRLCGIGVLVLLVALLAVGGMTFGGVNETLWLLLALGLNATELGPDHKKSLPWFVNVVLLAVIVALWFAQHQTAYEPMLEAAERGRSTPQRRCYPPRATRRNQEQQLLDAAAADPLAVEPRRLLADLRLDQWQQEEKQGHRSSELATQAARRLRNVDESGH